MRDLHRQASSIRASSSGAIYVEYIIVLSFLIFAVFVISATFQPKAESFFSEASGGAGVSYPQNYIPEPSPVVSPSPVASP